MSCKGFLTYEAKNSTKKISRIKNKNKGRTKNINGYINDVINIVPNMIVVNGKLKQESRAEDQSNML